jgi:tetratricopeptide (TPR) repeat protein
MHILCRALYMLRGVNWRLGNIDGVIAAFEESLALAQAIGDVPRELAALNGLGVAYLHTDGENAERFLTEVLMRSRAVGSREREMIALANLGVLEDERANDGAARNYHQKALVLPASLAHNTISHIISAI